MGKDRTLWPGCRRRAVSSLKANVLENWLCDAPFALGALSRTVVLSLTSAREQLWEGAVMRRDVCRRVASRPGLSRWGLLLFPQPWASCHQGMDCYCMAGHAAMLQSEKSTQLFFPFVYLKIITQKKTSGETSSSLQKKKSPGKKTAGSYFHIYHKVDLHQVITTFKNKLKEFQRYLFFPTSLWFE